jgi:hypothetical protein
MRYTNLPLTLDYCAAIQLRWPRTVEPLSTLLGRTAAILALGVLFTTTDGVSAAEKPSPLAGHWHSAETADEKMERLKIIDEATGHLGAFLQSKARSRLSERTSPALSLIIEIEGVKVTVASEDGRLEFELGGSPVEVSGSEGKAQVSANMQGALLIISARSIKGERTTAYHASGDRLKMEVTMTGTRLAKSLKYFSTYIRRQ